MSNGRYENRRRDKNRKKDKNRQQQQQNHFNEHNPLAQDSYYETKAAIRAGMSGRPRWKPLRQERSFLPSPVCPLCGEPINDLASAINDRTTGEPVHFDCLKHHLEGQETLEWGDSIAYIGGGRFGVVHFPSLDTSKDFRIKKVIEYEKKEEKAAWQTEITEQYSNTEFVMNGTL
ncbi:MAG: hypothetical protein LBM77_11310 [Spirochaetaceae bacterium]|jgi:hypothetical protein|nr:hypothetical protein [Spirochaetaceae bacterium]